MGKGLWIFRDRVDNIQADHEPSTLVKAIEPKGEKIFILPNNGNVILAANQA